MSPPFRPPSRSVHDIVTDDARRRDSRRDETIPPPSFDVETTPQAPRHRSIRSLDPAKVKEWIGVLVLAGGMVVNGFFWFQNRASKQDVADAQKADAEACTEAIKKALEPVIAKELALEKHDARDDKRWDALDAFHANAPAFNRPNTTKPPKFGPTAQAHGATTFDLEDDR